MLGSAENVDDASDKFAAVDAGMRLYRMKPGSRPHSAPAPAAAPRHDVLHARAEPAGREGFCQKASFSF
jgi:hypothetical protein